MTSEGYIPSTSVESLCVDGYIEISVYVAMLILIGIIDLQAKWAIYVWIDFARELSHPSTRN